MRERIEVDRGERCMMEGSEVGFVSGLGFGYRERVVKASCSRRWMRIRRRLRFPSAVMAAVVEVGEEEGEEEGESEGWAEEEEETEEGWNGLEPMEVEEHGEGIEGNEQETRVRGGMAVAVSHAAMLPVVAVIGRPNVGKSMLVNRLAETYKGGSIVEDVVGITRDRTYRRAFWLDYEYQIVDTGGLVFREDKDIVFLKEIREQALLALDEAKAVIFVVDGQGGPNPLDHDIANFLRKECKVPVVLAVNKCESQDGDLRAAEFWELGMGTPFPISAIHGTGTGDFLDQVVVHLPKVSDPAEDTAVNVAIVGKPNVGKSSILNKLVGKSRAIVSEIPGTTRDTVDELVERNGVVYRLLDTAGIRKKKSIEYGTEFFMINRAFKAIRRSDVVVLVIDIMEGVSEQECRLAERIKKEGRACVIAANKWDLVPEKDNKSHGIGIRYLEGSLRVIPWAAAVIVSAETGQRLPSLLDAVDDAVEQHRRRVSTAILNEVLKDAVDFQKPPTTATLKSGKIYYCTQVSSRPPTIALFVNDAKLFRDNYRRYIEGQFRKSLGFRGTPLRILWRSKGYRPASGGPYKTQ